MKTPILLLVVAASAALLTGCVNPSGSGMRMQGRVVSQEYSPWSGLAKGDGLVQVVFAPDSPQPPTYWRLLAARPETGRQRVLTDVSSAIPGCLPDTLGLYFSIDPRYAEHHPNVCAPEPRMVTVMERQLLLVKISYAKPVKTSATPDRRRSR